MGLFTHYNPLDRIYICPVQYEHEQMPTGQEVYLFCDSKGNSTTAIVETSVLENARNAIKQLRYEGRGGAILCIEITPGQSATFATEISAEEAEALAQIHQFAFEAGVIRHYLKIPDHLRKYPAQIIKRGKKALKKEQERTARIQPDAAIILKRLPPNEQTPPGMQKVLILDYRGISCNMRIAVEALDDAEKTLEQWRKIHNNFGVIVFSTSQEGFLEMAVIKITEAENEALNMVKQHFEATGCSMDPIPTGVKSILARAKVRLSVRNSENANR